MSSGKIIAVCKSNKKGIPKADEGSGSLVVGFGLEGDAHGGDWQANLASLDRAD